MDDELGSTPIARVHENYLYPEDLEGLISRGTSKEDSANRVERYVSNWIRKQLVIDEASSKMELDEAEIQRKILDYRYSLIGYEYQSYVINQNLDRNIPFEEIQQYYDDHIDNFLLKQNIFKGKFIKVPLEAPKISTAKRWLRNKNESDLEELRSYCLTYATLYNLEDSVWVNFDELVQGSRLAEDQQVVQKLRNNTMVELNDEESLYLLMVEDHKSINDTAPIEIVADQIKNIILNKRKVELAKNLEEDIYERAKEGQEFEIYN